MNLIRLIYMSRATEPMSSEQLETILKKSRTNNQGLDITGLLLYKNQNFFQVLEGPSQSVWSRYHHIMNDPRHQDIEMLCEEPIEIRDFPEWNMGFINLDQAISPLAGFTDFLTRAQPTNSSIADMSSGHRFANIFKTAADLL